MPRAARAIKGRPSHECYGSHLSPRALAPRSCDQMRSPLRSGGGSGNYGSPLRRLPDSGIHHPLTFATGRPRRTTLGS